MLETPRPYEQGQKNHKTKITQENKVMNSLTMLDKHLNSQNLLPTAKAATKAFLLPYMAFSIANRTYWYTNIHREELRVDEIRASKSLIKFELKDGRDVIHAMRRKALVRLLQKPSRSGAIIALAVTYLTYHPKQLEISKE